MEIAILRAEHLEAASKLFAARYREERGLVPALPSRHDDGRTILPGLTDLSRQAPGVAALENGELRGYLIGLLPIPSFKGTQRGAYSPIWAHAAVGDDRARVYRLMYERISGEWVGQGCLTHAITLYAQDGEAIDVWFRNCFGLLVVDALRSLSPVPGPELPEVVIRQAGQDDMDLILPLARDLSRYMSDAPIFLAPLEVPDRAEYAPWLAEPDHALWLALHDGEAIGYIRVQPPGFDVAYVVSDPGTISITGAYVRAEWRSKGVAAMLLRRVVEWARASGYQRCSVDFESQNIYGSRFWLSHFQPICHSLIRRVDERVTRADADEPAEGVR